MQTLQFGRRRFQLQRDTLWRRREGGAWLSNLRPPSRPPLPQSCTHLYTFHFLALQPNKHTCSYRPKFIPSISGHGRYKWAVPLSIRYSFEINPGESCCVSRSYSSKACCLWPHVYSKPLIFFMLDRSLLFLLYQYECVWPVTKIMSIHTRANMLQNVQ